MLEGSDGGAVRLILPEGTAGTRGESGGQKAVQMAPKFSHILLIMKAPC